MSEFSGNGAESFTKITSKKYRSLTSFEPGHVSQFPKKYEEAEECLEQAHQLASTLKDAQTEGKILNEIAKLYLTKDKTEETIDILLKIRKLCQENKIEVDEELSLMKLGQAYEKKGEFNNAIQIMKEGKRKAKEAGNGPCMGTPSQASRILSGWSQEFVQRGGLYGSKPFIGPWLGEKKR